MCYIIYDFTESYTLGVKKDSPKKKCNYTYFSTKFQKLGTLLTSVKREGFDFQWEIIDFFILGLPYLGWDMLVV